MSPRKLDVRIEKSNTMVVKLIPAVAYRRFWDLVPAAASSDNISLRRSGGIIELGLLANAQGCALAVPRYEARCSRCLPVTSLIFKRRQVTCQCRGVNNF